MGTVQMSIREEVEVLPSKDRRPQTWKDLFHSNLDTLFEMALLLTADPREAEATLTRVINTVDMSRLPDEGGLSILQAAVAQKSIESGAAIVPSGVEEARPMLQLGLQPVVQVERVPRVCFVLRTMLGYATTTCAGILGVNEDAVKVLLRIAILQLHEAFCEQQG
jgi:hypothetical protein